MEGGTEDIIAGSVSTGFDLYNGEASTEETAMNFILGGGLAGKSWDKQLSVNAIYKGVISVNEHKSDSEIMMSQSANVISITSSELVDYLFKNSDKYGLFKQIASNVLSGYIENKIEQDFKEKEDNKKGEKAK